MLDAHSAINQPAVEREGLVLREQPDFTIVQLGWFDKADEKALRDAFGVSLPKAGIASAGEDWLLMRIAPRQVWVVAHSLNAELPELPVSIVQTPLSSGRSRMALTGAQARDVLSRCAPLDFHGDEFKPGQFAMTGIHHTPVLIHCFARDVFHIYALRTFARAVWDMVADATSGLAR